MPTRGLIPIPSDLSPVGTRCIPVVVPDDPEWVGMFFGALYNLSVWSSYDRDVSNSGKTLANAWKIIIADAKNSDPCRKPECSVVYADQNTGWLLHDNTTGSDYFPDFCDACDTREGMMTGNRRFNATLGIADQAFQFKALLDDTVSGVHICEFRAWAVETVTPNNVWNFQWEDCLSQVSNETPIGDLFFKSDFIAKRWGLSSLAAYAYYVKWDGPILCSEI